jgi:pilus assembly protein Flp/PilA
MTERCRVKPMPRFRSMAAKCRLLCVRLITARATEERGASLVEYALLVALIAVVCVGAISALGASASSKFSNISSSLK